MSSTRKADLSMHNPHQNTFILWLLVDRIGS